MRLWRCVDRQFVGEVTVSEGLIYIEDWIVGKCSHDSIGEVSWRSRGEGVVYVGARDGAALWSGDDALLGAGGSFSRPRQIPLSLKYLLKGRHKETPALLAMEQHQTELFSI